MSWSTLPTNYPNVNFRGHKRGVMGQKLCGLNRTYLILDQTQTLVIGI